MEGCLLSAHKVLEFNPQQEKEKEKGKREGLECFAFILTVYLEEKA